MASSAVRQAAGNLKIAVLRLPWTVGTRELRDHFSQYGGIKYCRVIFDHNTGFSKGFGFVQFVRESSFNEALSTHHKIDGEQVIVQQTLDDDLQQRDRRTTRGHLSRRTENLIDSLPI